MVTKRELTTVSPQTAKISLVEDGDQVDHVLRIIEGTKDDGCDDDDDDDGCFYNFDAL